MTPSWTMLSRPPTALATTGTPHAAASSATSPKLSLRLGTIDHVGGAVVAGQDVVRLRLDEADPIGDAEVVDERLGAAASASPSTPLAPPTTTSSASRGQLGRAARIGHVGRLQRLDPPDEQHDRPIGRAARRRARAPVRSPGAKKACSTAGGTISMRPAGSP